MGLTEVDRSKEEEEEVGWVDPHLDNSKVEDQGWAEYHLVPRMLVVQDQEAIAPDPTLIHQAQGQAVEELVIDGVSRLHLASRSVAVAVAVATTVSREDLRL